MYELGILCAQQRREGIDVSGKLPQEGRIIVRWGNLDDFRVKGPGAA
jgi:hypothetical protein